MLAKKKRFIICLVIILMSGLCILAGANLDAIIDFIGSPSASGVDAAREEVRLLIEKMIASNPDSHLQTIHSNPITYYRGQIFSRCIKGYSELIFQANRSLNDVALNYSNLFDTKFSKSQGESYYIEINEKIRLVINPTDTLPYPDVCKVSGSCYSVFIYYSDDHSNGQCTE